MATNLDKLKSEIAQMSAKEFAGEFMGNIKHQNSFTVACDRTPSWVCKKSTCIDCAVKWLNESEDDKQNG